MKNLMSTVIKRIISFVICLVLICATASPCFAASEKTMTVNVGFFEFDGYHMQNSKGVRSGYGYDMLQHMAGYVGLQYNYVGYDKSWNEMQEMLANGEIDILTSAQKTPERLARFDFSANNIGLSSAILTVKAGDKSFIETDYDNWNGMRVGMIKGNSRNASFADFAVEHGFSYESVYFEDTDEMVAELEAEGQDKQIDAILTSNLRKIKNEWILAQFAPSPFFVMVRKGNTELLDRINRAITQLDLCEPGLRTRLMNEYYAADNGSNIAFTPEERAYIESMQSVSFTALINPDRAPYSWYEDGEYHGIIYDISKIITSRIGLKVEYIEAKDRIEYNQKLSENPTAIRFDMDSPYSQAEKEGYWLTSAYMTVPLSRLVREDTTRFKSVAIPINSSTEQDFGNDMDESDITVVKYNSVAQAVQAVMDKKQDMAYLAEDTAKMAVRDDITNRLVTEEMLGQTISYRIAVSYSHDSRLYSILTKAILSLNTDEINAIRLDYADNLEKPFSIIGYFYDYPLHAVAGVAAILGIAILFIIFATNAKRRKEQLAHAKKDHEQNLLLRDALDEAEKAGMAKSQFLSRVSHEMRTPLNAIIGFIELAKGTDKEQMEDYLSSSGLAAKQLLSVINDVLDMSSIESGKMKIASAPFNFRHLITSITNIYGTQCKQKGIAYETKIETPVDDWIIGDELRVNQILMNLLGNAVKFTSKGHIWLTISETVSDKNLIFLRFTVSDTGCGMSDEMKKRLFKPFEQESASTAKKYGGNGLGLSIVKNLIGIMGGTVKVESKVGEGTDFIVDLPFKRSKTGQLSLPNKAESLHILAVDDEKTERDYISAVLSRMKVRFTCVSSGSEALEELDKAEKSGDLYNVCLIDWCMPGMNGVDTTSRIREKYGEDVVVIVVSAYDFQQASESAKQAGASLFLSKPIFQSSLFDLLLTLTGGDIAQVKDEPKNWDFAGARVLLAEDNALNQIVTKGYLAKFNAVVDIAENGKVALEMFEASEPGYYSAILMDIQMPVMDGYESTRAIRASTHPDAKSIQIIAQSADAFNEDIARSLSAGMNAHVAKPIKPETLARALYKAFMQNKGEKND